MISAPYNPVGSRSSHVSVIPEGSGGVCLEYVPEAVPRLDGALGDIWYTVHPGSVVLELTVPVDGDRLCGVGVADIDYHCLPV